MQPGSWPTADPLLGEEPRRLERTITTLDELAALRRHPRWLAGRPLPDEALEDLLLGISEASMNAVEHGTPPVDGQPSAPTMPATTSTLPCTTRAAGSARAARR
ncbi:MAG: hypothetical protein R2711_12230 [Acidimicrobiales bacterium]